MHFNVNLHFYALIHTTILMTSAKYFSFIGVLYENGLLVSSIMDFCLAFLLNRYKETEDEASLECGVKLFETIGQFMIFHI